MIIAGYYCYLTGWKWTVSSSFRVAESEYQRWWHFGGVYRGELQFLRTIFSVGSVDLIVSFANAQNWILQPIVIATICSLPMFRPEVACYFPCSRCPALIIQTWRENFAHAYVTSGIASIIAWQRSLRCGQNLRGPFLIATLPDRALEQWRTRGRQKGS